MASLFKTPVRNAINNLKKHLKELSEDDNKKQKAITKLTEDIAQIHFILYGDSDKDPNPEHIAKLVPQLIDTENGDLFRKLAQYVHLFEFEAKKQTAGIMNYIVRRCSKYETHTYIKSKTDKKTGHNVIIDCLLRGYHDQHLAQNVGSVLQEMAKRQELAPMLLFEIRITRKKQDKEDKQDGGGGGGDEEKDPQKDSASKPVSNGNNDNNDMVERSVVDELFILVQKPAFDVASDAYKTLQLLLTRNKKHVQKYLTDNYDIFFNQVNKLIQSENYVTQRQFLNLLSEILLEKENRKSMFKYADDKANLKIIMTLLKSKSNAIAHEAFHIFKIFVAKPRVNMVNDETGQITYISYESLQIKIVLYKNCEKLIDFLGKFLNDKAKEDENFAQERKTVITYLEQLKQKDDPQKEARERQKKRAQSQALNDTGNNNNTSSLEKIKHSKSVPNVPNIVDNNDNDNDNDGQ